MTSTALRSFAADAERHLDDPHAIGTRLGALLAYDGWLAPEHRVAGHQTYRQHLLYVSPSRRLSIVALVWLPGQRTPIHDHVAWCVVGVYGGRERETRYRAIEVGGERCLEPVGSIDARPGHVEVIVPSAQDIHSVTAVGPGPTISIHVYGADIERLGSSIYRRFDDWPVGRGGLRTAACSCGHPPACLHRAAHGAFRPHSGHARDPGCTHAPTLVSLSPAVMHPMLLASITGQLTTSIAHHGAYAVFAIMAVDALLPVGGELTMLFAGALAAGAIAGQHPVLLGHTMQTGLESYVVLSLAGALGYLLGSLVGWAVGRWGGRSLLERHGRWLHVTPENLDHAERRFHRHGRAAVFLGRLTPVVRSFISIPAGALESPLGAYTALTLAGSAIWCFGFAGAGWALGSSYDNVHHALRYVDVLAMASVVLALAAALVQHRRRVRT